MYTAAAAASMPWNQAAPDHQIGHNDDSVVNDDDDDMVEYTGHHSAHPMRPGNQPTKEAKDASQAHTFTQTVHRQWPAAA